MAESDTLPSFVDVIWNGSTIRDAHSSSHLSRTKQTFAELLPLDEGLDGAGSNLDRIMSIKEYFLWTPFEKLELDKYSKSAVTSSQLRERANMEYKNRNFQSALRGYNLAIQFGPVGGPDLSLAYGNRSAVLLHLNKPADALRDIDLGLGTGRYPLPLQRKIHERRRKCEDMISKATGKVAVIKNSIENTGELFSVQSRGLGSISCAADFVKIDHNPTCGRKLVVTQEVPSGTVLLVEKPYATVLEGVLDLDHCHFCYRRTDAGIPCSCCVFATFCGPACQQAATGSFHQYEHDLLQYFHSNQMSEFDLLGMRIVTTAGPKVLYDLFKGRTTLTDNSGRILGCNPETGLYESGYVQTYHLITHRSSLDLSNAFTALVLLHLLQELTGFFSGLTYGVPGEETQFLDFVASLLLHHLENIPYNAVRFSELRSGISLPFGTGIFPTLSLVNHSCTPNAVHVRDSEHCRTALIALKRLLPGEEITITYGPTFGLKNRLDRQAELTEKYKFDCQCQACSEDWSGAVTTMEAELSRVSCRNCSWNQKCGPCMGKIHFLVSQIEIYEAKLHEAHDLLLADSLGDNGVTLMSLLRPCLDFFGSTFSPAYQLTQVAQELFKKALVSLVR